MFGAALEGKAAGALGRTDVPHSLSYLPDLARAMVILGDRDEAAGRAWHLPVTDPLTVRAFLDRVYAAAGTPAKIQLAGPAMVKVLGLFVPMMREVGVVLYQWNEPWVSDWSAFETAFGPFERTPLDQAIATTLDWWREELAARAAREGRLRASASAACRVGRPCRVRPGLEPPGVKSRLLAATAEARIRAESGHEPSTPAVDLTPGRVIAPGRVRAGDRGRPESLNGRPGPTERLPGQRRYAADAPAGRNDSTTSHGIARLRRRWIERSAWTSSGATSEIAVPDAPARPVRPIRWM